MPPVAGSSSGRSGCGGADPARVGGIGLFNSGRSRAPWPMAADRGQFSDSHDRQTPAYPIAASRLQRVICPRPFAEHRPSTQIKASKRLSATVGRGSSGGRPSTVLSDAAPNTYRSRRGLLSPRRSPRIYVNIRSPSSPVPVRAHRAAGGRRVSDSVPLRSSPRELDPLASRVGQFPTMNSEVQAIASRINPSPSPRRRSLTGIISRP